MYMVTWFPTLSVRSKSASHGDAGKSYLHRSRSAYASPVVLLRKRNDTWPFCVNYRALYMTLPAGSENYPLPLIKYLLSYLNG